MIRVILGLGGLCALLCTLPLVFGLFLMLLYIVYCIIFAWLTIIPIFSGHFRFMCRVWYLGLDIVSKTWKVGLIGFIVNWILSGLLS